ncbi:MAG: acyl carrier protein [Clostridiales bacterium]|nr:acyl carrier protein [Clostridiales bacterium]
MKTIDKVKHLIAEQLCISVEDIKDDANIIEDLGADSLDVVELLMSFEDEFKVSIPDEKLEELKTIPQIVAIIDEYVKK